MTNEQSLKILKEWLPELELMARYNDDSLSYQRYSAIDDAIKFIESHQYPHDKCMKCVEFSEFEAQPHSITLDELEDRLDALYEKIRDSCMEYYINGQRKMFVDADECSMMVYEILEVFDDKS